MIKLKYWDIMVAPRVGCIYTVINTKNGKRKPGKTVNTVEERWIAHIEDAGYVKRKRKKPNHLSNSINHHGLFHFKAEQLLVIYFQEDFYFYEDYYIVVWDTMNPYKGYNKKRGGSNGKLSENTKEKITKILNTPEIRKKISEGVKRKWKDPEFRRRQSEGVKRKWKDPEFRKKQSEGVKKGHETNYKRFEKAKQKNDLDNMRWIDLYELIKENNISQKEYSLTKKKMIKFIVDHFKNLEKKEELRMMF